MTGVRLSHASATKVRLYYMEMEMSSVNKELLVQVHKWRRTCSAFMHSSIIESSTWKQCQHSLLTGTWFWSILADPVCRFAISGRKVSGEHSSERQC